MKYFFTLFSLFCFGAIAQQAAAQCGAGQSFVQVVIQADNYGTETNWQLTNSNSTVSYGGVVAGAYPNNSPILYSQTFCVPSASCTRFRMADTYGDGICCNYGSGYYLLIVDGDTIARDSSFGRERITTFNCPPGSSCNSAITVINGSHTTSFGEQWYWFSPTVTGMYNFNTCGGNGCDTKLWIYDNCNHTFDTSNVGTLYYNDNSCGLRSSIDAAMAAGTPYLIRVGDRANACNGNVGFNIIYNGPIRGCTDPSACNYNPLATVSDTCIYFGNPNCPLGPDLFLRQDVIRNSLQLTTYNSIDPCLATEECVSGMGMRDIVRFTTHIENNGARDYYVGVPGPNNPQFTYGNCHNHWHHESYAQYLLFDSQGNMLPIGMKNGFCVMDLTCDHGGTAQYGCGNMGISQGCGDIYDSSLQCQWVDVTDVPDGDYQLVIRVNWNYSPDALGVYETDYDNNWANACFNLSRATGSPQMTILPNCAPYTDCMGVLYGSAVRDCNGVCNGSGIRGDVNSNQNRETTDVNAYLNHITAQDLAASECIDLHRDNGLDVYDAALLQRCLNDSSRCTFPTGLYNSIDTAILSIIDVQTVGQDSNGYCTSYVDIGIRNPTNTITAYQFSLTGLALALDDNYAPISLVGANYPVQIVQNSTTNIIAALSPVDSAFRRSYSIQPLCRIHFKTQAICAMSVCIDSIYSIVTGNYQSLATKKEDACYETINTNRIANDNLPALSVSVAPNPFKNQTVISFENNVAPLRLQLYDALGALVFTQENVITRQYVLGRNNLTAGIYFLKISADNSQQTVKIVIE